MQKHCISLVITVAAKAWSMAPFLPPAFNQDDEQAILDLAMCLIAFDTGNPPGNEEPAIRFLAGYLGAAGVAVEVQVLAPNRANLIARLPGRGEAGHLVLSGHMDVVPAGASIWTFPPYSATCEGGRLYGRGAADMKGGLAAMAIVMARLARAGYQPRGDLILAVSAGEEAEGIGARAMVESGVLAGSTALVLGEFTGLDVYIAQKGVGFLEITAHGAPAHSAMPWLGQNAVAYMAQVVTALQANPYPWEPSPILGQPTVSVCTITGGNKINVIPDSCSIQASIRTVPGQTREMLLDRTRRLLDRIAVETGIQVRTAFTLQSSPSVSVPEDHPLVQVALDAVEAVRGVRPPPGGVPYGTDGLVLAPAYSLPAIIVGPGHFEQAHQIDEWVPIPELYQAARIYQEIVLRLLG
jgi:succinyl-diaminopimelate desuccinylase